MTVALTVTLVFIAGMVLYLVQWFLKPMYRVWRRERKKG